MLLCGENSLLHGCEQNTNYANYTNKGLHCNQLLLSYFSPSWENKTPIYANVIFKALLSTKVLSIIYSYMRKKIVTHNTSVPPFTKRASDFY